MKNSLHKKIMRRTYSIFFLRKVINATALKLYAALGALALSTQYVSFGNVFANMRSLSGFSNFYQFGVSSFVHTEFAVQLLSVWMCAVVLLIIKEFIPNLTHAKSPELTRL